MCRFHLRGRTTWDLREWVDFLTISRIHCRIFVLSCWWDVWRDFCGCQLNIYVRRIWGSLIWRDKLHSCVWGEPKLWYRIFFILSAWDILYIFERWSWELVDYLFFIRFLIIVFVIFFVIVLFIVFTHLSSKTEPSVFMEIFQGIFMVIFTEIVREIFMGIIIIFFMLRGLLEKLVLVGEIGTYFSFSFCFLIQWLRKLDRVIQGQVFIRIPRVLILDSTARWVFKIMKDCQRELLLYLYSWRWVWGSRDSCLIFQRRFLGK